MKYRENSEESVHVEIRKLLAFRAAINTALG